MTNKNSDGFISKIKKWMFPDYEEIATEEPKKQKRSVSVQGAQPLSRPVKRRHDVKVLRQYPKGSFRFPVIKDTPVEKKESSQSPNISNGSLSRSNTEQRDEMRPFQKKMMTPQKPLQEESDTTEKRMFQGHDFKARSIPSPVHGYRERQSKTASTFDNKKRPIVRVTPLNKEGQTDISMQDRKEKSTIEKDVTHHIEASRVKASSLSENTDQAVQISRWEKKETVESSPFGRSHLSATQQPRELYPHSTGPLLNGSNRASNESDRLLDAQKQEAEIQNDTVEQPFSQSVNKDDVQSHFELSPSFNNDRVDDLSEAEESTYDFPRLNLLNHTTVNAGDDDWWLDEKAHQLNSTFEYFHIRAHVTGVTKGPAVTRFEVQPEPGVKVSKIVNLTDDLKLSLAAREIRIEAPIPGKNTIGIEVPNENAEPVFLRELLDSSVFQQHPSPLAVAMGKGLSGEPVIMDLQKMPHGLIAGATGSGKSVCVNSILTSIIYKASPADVRLLLIDPKIVELAPYNDIPHLAAPVINDPKEATESLKWAVAEMERRYEKFAKAGARDMARYNEKMKQSGQDDDLLPYILIVVDELADLMMVAPQDVEDAICRIAQKARACGIHLLVATQRPSVDVITGLIKANIPTRVAFSVSSQADSRTILDGGGAEKLLGKGDMLLLESGTSKPVRLQGTFVSDDEIERVVDYVKHSPHPGYLFEKAELKEQVAAETEDPLFEEVCDFVVEHQAASASLIQRRFRIGYNRAARMIDDMEARGMVSPQRGSKPREVYLTNHVHKDDNR
ncbi:DNA translocase FtsK [Salipaludibacillus sp. LMS25]|uniref:DNA translocase FtsK n=1 Tax=Salipaludibacillus sp. LMS25 TaxID=2924031 RepID=UPI0026F37925|nr:DNA translocase FtsK [Salipaludibacillus sp. LMS25]